MFSVENSRAQSRQTLKCHGRLIDVTSYIIRDILILVSRTACPPCPSLRMVSMSLRALDNHAHCSFTILFSSGMVISLEPNSTPSCQREACKRMYSSLEDTQMYVLSDPG